MYTILIADDNIAFAKLLVNDIVGKMDNLRVIKIATDGKETLEIMQNQTIDIVLLDLKMPIYSGVDILSMLSDQKKKEYENSIIIVTGEPEYLHKVIGNPMMYSFVMKGPGQYDKIIRSIYELLDKKSNDFKKRQIINELKCMGYNINHKGTQYLAEAIYEIYLHQDSFDGNLKKEIYPILSIAFQKSVHNIKCNITRATENMRYYCPKDVKHKYFGNFQPNPKFVINVILNKIA